MYYNGSKFTMRHYLQNANCVHIIFDSLALPAMFTYAMHLLRVGYWIRYYYFIRARFLNSLGEGMAGAPFQ